MTETIKYTDRPYFVLEGNICALLAAKDHVNVFLYDGAIVPDPEGIITGGHENETARTVAVREGETINAPALTAMFTQIIANNRAGGWRKLKHENSRRHRQMSKVRAQITVSRGRLRGRAEPERGESARRGRRAPCTTG